MQIATLSAIPIETVNQAFADFMTNYVNLPAGQTDLASKSRDWLFRQIQGFPEASTDFPLLAPAFDIAFGSLARRTKIRPLDDVDVIPCLHATGGTYMDWFDGSVRITVPAMSRLSRFCHADGRTLNSTRIINRFVKALEQVPQYEAAAINRREEAATLSLSSYPWTFDIVPGFITAPERDGRSYYLIPDGQGHWKKTDPRIDRDRIARIDTQNGGRVLSAIRLSRFWNRRPTMPSAPTYMFEVMVSELYETREATPYVDLEFAAVLDHVGTAIWAAVPDPKSIQGNLNVLTLEERTKISDRAVADARRAQNAALLKQQGDQRGAIRAWEEILGPDFTVYG